MQRPFSKHFTRAEFACNCGCGFDTVDFELVQTLEKIREHFDQPVTITSGCRCATYNKAIGGEPGSQHMRGRAADIQVKNIPPALVHELAELLGVGGLGEYPTFTHIDTRHGKSRWAGA